MHGLQVVEEGGVPAVEGDEEQGDAEAGTEDGGRGEEFEWDEGFVRVEGFVEGEEEEEYRAED